MNVLSKRINFYYFKTLRVKKYYFAYGSNLDQARLEGRVGKVIKLGIYKVYGWQLVFNAGLSTQVFANLVFTGNHINTVEGVIYELSTKQIKILDKFEGAPHLYTRMILDYNRKDLQVYVSINPFYTQQAVNNILPSVDYLNHIIKGATENKIDSVLQRCLKILPFAPKNKRAFN